MAEERKTGVVMPHNIVLEDRKLLTVSGVSDVDSFDEETVVIFTDMGELTVEGEISALIYSDEAPKSGGFFSKVFR